MYIYSLQITTENGIAPIYEVHSWEKVEEIIKATKELSDKPFTWSVFGNSGR